MNEKFWLILDTSENESAFFDPFRFPDGVDQRIPPNKRSKMVYEFKENAEREIIRLATQNPHGDFYLMEATDYAHQLSEGNYAIRSTIANS